MMLAYVVRRTLYGVVTVLGVLLLLFVLFFLVTKPEDIARKAIGEKAPPAAIAQWIANHGYDKPAFWNPAAPADTLIERTQRTVPTRSSHPSRTSAITSASAIATNTSSPKSGSASARLGPAPSRIRREIGTSSASLRPKSKVSMRRMCSASRVSSGLCGFHTAGLS